MCTDVASRIDQRMVLLNNNVSYYSSTHYYKYIIYIFICTMVYYRHIHMYIYIEYGVAYTYPHSGTHLSYLSNCPLLPSLPPIRSGLYLPTSLIKIIPNCSLWIRP